MHFLTLLFRPSALFFLLHVLPLAAAIDRAAAAPTLNQIFNGRASRGDDSVIAGYIASRFGLSNLFARHRTSRAKYLPRYGNLKVRLGRKTREEKRSPFLVRAADVGFSFSYSFLNSPQTCNPHDVRCLISKVLALHRWPFRSVICPTARRKIYEQNSNNGRVPRVSPC
jgi:hypothetical protein